MKVKINLKRTGADLLKAIQERKDNEANIVIKDVHLVSMTKDICIGLCKKIGLEFRDGFEKRVIQFRFTDATADRHNEVVKPEGVDLKSFKKDPIILLQHASRKFPIGKSLHTEFDRDKNDIVGKILFFDDEIDRTGVSEDTFRMVKSGAMKNGSIGFTAKSEHVRLASPDEVKEHKLDKFGIIFDKIELREFSIVTIGANPRSTSIPARKDAFRQSTIDKLKEDGLTDEDLIFLKGKDEDVDDETINSNDQNKEVTPMDISINISKNAGTEEIETKMKFAKIQQDAGNDVTISYGEKEETIINNISNDVNKLNDKNKDLINNVLTGIKTLSESFEALLNNAEPSKNKDDNNDGSGKDDPIDKDSDPSSAPSELYKVLEEHNNSN